MHFKIQLGLFNLNRSHKSIFESNLFPQVLQGKNLTCNYLSHLHVPGRCSKFSDLTVICTRLQRLLWQQELSRNLDISKTEAISTLVPT